MGRMNGRRSLQETLRRRAQSCMSAYSTVNDIVHYLRSTYPDCHRMKLRTLTSTVHQILQSRANHVPATPSAARKRRKRIYESDEIEGTSSTSFSACPSSSASESDGAVSVPTSEEFDFTKTMLHNSYNTGAKDNVKKKKMKKKPVVEEKNVELEVTNSSKATNEVGVVNGGGGEAKSTRKHLNSFKGSVSNGRGRGGCDAKVKGKERPRFKDLGGMREMLEQL